MLAMRVMQVARDEVIDVIAVRDGLVSAVGRVHVALGVPLTGVRRRASGGVRIADLEHALVHVPIVAVVEMPVVQVVDVVAVANCDVAAVGAVDVIVARVRIVAHDFFLPGGGEATTAGSLA
jgi:hypothetical protein